MSPPDTTEALGTAKIFVRRPDSPADYDSTWRNMQAFTRQRDAHTPDEIWILQHAPVYTLGLAGKMEHLLQSSDIPLVKVDRGGQITYHGPGQIVAYLLIDLRRRHLTVKRLVRLMEESVLALLARHGVEAELLPGAPGVYVAGAKVAALGLRVQRGCSYHGLSLNVNMDLSPFQFINPCGYAGLPVTQTSDLGIRDSMDALENQLLQELILRLDTFPPTS